MTPLLPMMLGSIGAATGAIGSIVGSAESIRQEDRNYKQRERLYKYQKQMQQQAWSREDNAVGRRMADLRQSGLNPNLAAGSSAGASGPVALKAPIRDTGPTERAGQIPGQIIERFANIAQTLAQKDYLDSQKDFQTIKNFIQGETIPDQISSIQSSADTAYSTSRSAAASAKVATSLVDTHIDTAISSLETINENRKQSIDRFGATLEAIVNKNKISKLDIKHLKDTVEARISNTKSQAYISNSSVTKMSQLLKPLVGKAEAERLLEELKAADLAELNNAQKAKRQLFWGNLWKALGFIVPNL